MGKMSPGMRMLAVTQARRHRDERGRYMDGDQGGMDMQRGGHRYPQERRGMDGEMRDRPDMRMGYAGATPDMRRYHSPMDNRPREMSGYQHESSNDAEEPAEMRGEGYFVWDGPDHLPPARYGQPQSRRNVTDMRQYQRTRSMMGEDGEKNHQQGMIGFGEQDNHGKKLTKEKAEKWVKHMRSGDHRGEMWTMEDAKELAKKYKIEDKQELLDFYAALNMMHSDYSDVAKEWGVDNEDFYAALACAFLYDDDGKPPSEKLAAYYKYVVPHDEEE